MPTYSIITASLNNGPRIVNALDSIKNQTFQDFEHLVIDGGSIDETNTILLKYQNLYRLRWSSGPDNGIADALNKGIKRAKGRYILVIQADDQLLSSTVLEKIDTILTSKDVDILSCPVIVDHPRFGRYLRKPIRLLWWNHFKFILPHQGCFVNRRLFEKLGLFDSTYKIAMDYDFLYRALQNKATVRFHDYPVALMGGEGIGTTRVNIPVRLSEERKVQVLNETNTFWRFFQRFFWAIYFPFKTFPIKKVK
jgi:glycosyltransferase involved in cell wall biosynthesis